MAFSKKEKDLLDIATATKGFGEDSVAAKVIQEGEPYPSPLDIIPSEEDSKPVIRFRNGDGGTIWWNGNWDPSINVGQFNYRDQSGNLLGSIAWGASFGLNIDGHTALILTANGGWESFDVMIPTTATKTISSNTITGVRNPWNVINGSGTLNTITISGEPSKTNAILYLEAGDMSFVLGNSGNIVPNAGTPTINPGEVVTLKFNGTNWVQKIML